MISDQLLQMRRADTDNLNAMIENKQISRCKFSINPYAKEEHGAAYFRNYQKWAPGALRELLRLWNTHPDQHMFKCGTFGSVYFDVDLASKGVTKRTRVTFMKEEEDGRMWIMLDATFDDVFEACN